MDWCIHDENSYLLRRNNRPQEIKLNVARYQLNRFATYYPYCWARNIAIYEMKDKIIL